MNGDTLKSAAKIIVKSGAQIDALFDLTLKNLEEKLTEISHIGKIHLGKSEVVEDDGSWITTSYLKNLEIFTHKARKPTSHIALNVVLYDEKEVNIKGWEPSIYIMFSDDREPFEEGWLVNDMLEDDEFRQSKKDQRLWCTYNAEGADDYSEWLYVVPLVKINSVEDIINELVEPVRKVLEEDIDKQIFNEGSSVFKYDESEQKLSYPWKP